MVFVICCLALTYAVAVSGADNFAKFNQPAALGAYKDINDMAAADPVQVLGKTWKKFVYPDDYELPDKPALGAYQDIINNVKDPETVLGVRTFETKSVGYACRDASEQTKLCRLMEDDRTE